MKPAIAALLILASVGCAHRPESKIGAEFVTVECVVESFDPESLIFYGRDTIPYDAVSRVSQIRIIEPASLAGRVYSIDLLSAKDQGVEEWIELKQIGARIRFRLPTAMIGCSSKDLIPAAALQKEPNH